MTQPLSGIRIIDTMESIDLSTGGSISTSDPESSSGMVPIRVVSLTNTDQ
jgi:hypothetical protein